MIYLQKTIFIELPNKADHRKQLNKIQQSAIDKELESQKASAQEQEKIAKSLNFER